MLPVRPADIVVDAGPADLITVDEAKSWLRVDHGEEDGLIAMLVSAASSHLDGPRGVFGRAMGGGTYTVRHEAHIVGTRLGFGLSGDIDGDVAVNGVADPAVEVLRTHGRPYVLAVADQLTDQACTLTATFAAGVPDTARALALTLVSQMYHHREETVTSRAEANPQVRRLMNVLQTKWVA